MGRGGEGTGIPHGRCDSVAGGVKHKVRILYQWITFAYVTLPSGALGIVVKTLLWVSTSVVPINTRMMFLLSVRTLYIRTYVHYALHCRHQSVEPGSRWHALGRQLSRNMLREVLIEYCNEGCPNSCQLPFEPLQNFQRFLLIYVAARYGS